MYKHDSDKNKTYLSVVVFVLAPTNTSLYRPGMFTKSLVTVVDPNRTGFLISNTTPYLYQTFTKCVSSQYTHLDILTCQM